MFKLDPSIPINIGSIKEVLRYAADDDIVIICTSYPNTLDKDKMPSKALILEFFDTTIPNRTDAFNAELAKKIIDFLLIRRNQRIHLCLL